MAPLPAGQTRETVAGERNDADVLVRGVRFEASRQLEAIHAGQLNVHENEIWSQVSEHLKRRFGVTVVETSVQSFAFCLRSCLLDQVRREVESRDCCATASSRQREIAGATRNVQHAHTRP